MEAYKAFVVVLLGWVVVSFAVCAKASKGDDSELIESSVYDSAILLGAQYSMGMFYVPADDESNVEPGASIDLLVHIYELAYAAFAIQYNSSPFDSHVFSIAGGAEYRFDLLPVYFELKLLLGAEFEYSSGFNVQGVLLPSLGFWGRVSDSMELGGEFVQHLSFDEVANDPGVFMGLFSRKARYRSFTFGLRWRF